MVVCLFFFSSHCFILCRLRGITRIHCSTGYCWCMSECCFFFFIHLPWWGGGGGGGRRCLKMKCNGKNRRKIGDSKTRFFFCSFFFFVVRHRHRSFVSFFLNSFYVCVCLYLLRVSRVINNTNRQLQRTYWRENRNRMPRDRQCGEYYFRRFGLMVNCCSISHHDTHTILNWRAPQRQS